MSLIFAVDTGGTFTDIAVFDVDLGKVSCAKALTTYGELVDGVLQCVEEVGADLRDASLAKHGTTLVINTLLQRDGARVALITTKGFRDTLELGRGNRTRPFRMDYKRAPPLVPRDLRFEVDERIHGRGEVFKAPDLTEIDALAERLRGLNIEGVAVSFLNSYLNDSHEAIVTARLRNLLPDMYVTAGAELTRQWYEYERTCTAAANAITGPRTASYIRHLANQLRAGGFCNTLYMMGSNGGALSVERTLREPINLIESGPVGGCIGAGAYGEELGIKNLIAFDMGGTTAKCALIKEGKFSLHSPYFVGGYEEGFPIRTSVVDIVEIGAGGGSIAWVDEATRLHVGPQSAGSDPGPVAFCRGGSQPTVTDANLIVGRIGPEVFLGGELSLDLNAAEAAISEKVADRLGLQAQPIEATAHGILELATLNMTNAIRQITVERGVDPRDFSLFVFGGSGPIYAAELARELNIPQVIIPPEPGNFSAVGMLLADPRIDKTQTMIMDLNESALVRLDNAFEQITNEAVRTLSEEVEGGNVTIARTVDMRYRGQKHTFSVALETSPKDVFALRSAFEKYYQKRFGHSDETAPIEIVGVHVNAQAHTKKPDLRQLRRSFTSPSQGVRRRRVYYGDELGWLDVPIYRRDNLPIGFEKEGPAVIEEYSSTTVIGVKDQCLVGSLGEIQIRVRQS